MLSQNLKHLRKEKGLSQQELAEKTGASLASINGWESGRIQKIREGSLEKLATALSTTREALLTETVVAKKEVDDFSKEVSARIKEVRKKKKLKQEEVADKLGISKFDYIDIENASAEPGLSQLKTIAELLEVTLDELFGLEKAEPIEEINEVQEEKGRPERWIRQLSDAPEEVKEAMKKVWSVVRSISRNAE
ncbi:helix-turn-helix transcriptional regulator [Gorillibacterium massiliense]|uniref:helix-turn-helix transcriptional regulator n=1 Tax=Gorillibacterium massiliense TaxID=1280390 RepID=UPI0004B233AA|nr:helix-turn-helix transcriptional regulator [Gorillibacterium massiliense]